MRNAAAPYPLGKRSRTIARAQDHKVGGIETKKALHYRQGNPLYSFSSC